jgi:hypothetical protein
VNQGTMWNHIRNLEIVSLYHHFNKKGIDQFKKEGKYKFEKT